MCKGPKGAHGAVCLRTAKVARAVCKDDSDTSLERLGGTGKGHITRSLRSHSSVFLKDYLKPLTNIKHGNDIIQCVFLKVHSGCGMENGYGAMVNNSPLASVLGPLATRAL